MTDKWDNNIQAMPLLQFLREIQTTLNTAIQLILERDLKRLQTYRKLMEQRAAREDRAV